MSSLKRPMRLALPWRMPNFVLLDTGRPEIAHLLTAMLQAREARSWSHPQEPTSEDWWADILADPSLRTKLAHRHGRQAKSYRLSDELRPIILVECSKCDWKAGFSRDELIASHGLTCAMPSLLNDLAKPGCVRLGNQWDHCGVYYVEPIGDCSRQPLNKLRQPSSAGAVWSCPRKICRIQ
jgi:hypothetical protein